MKTLTLLPFVCSLMFCSGLLAESAKHPAAAASDSSVNASPDPNAWSIHTYRFPTDDLIIGFVSRERGQLRAPAMPAANASQADIEKFLRQSNEVMHQYLSTEAAIPLVPGSFAVYDRGNKTLAVRTLNSTHELLVNFAQVLNQRVSQYLSFNAHLVETDAATLRAMLKEASVQAEHRALWAHMQELISQGKAREAGMLRIDTRSGQRSNIERGERRTYGTNFTLVEQGWCMADQTERTVGTSLEIDPVIGPDGRTVDLSFALKNHYAPPTERWALIGQSTRGEKLESLVMDFHTGEVTTAITVLDGMTKMLGVWKPEGAPEPERADNLQTAFLTTDIVSVLPAESDRALQLLKTYGEKIEPTPPLGKKPPAEVLPSGMVLRRFRIPPDFLSATGSGDSGPRGGAAAAAPAEPFAVTAAPRTEAHGMRSVTAVDVLKIAGIPFPPGSSANFNAGTSELIVRNLPENQEKVAEYVDSLLRHIPQFISCSVQIVQADGKTLRDIAEQTRHLADHSAAWKVIEDAAAQGRVKILNTSWLETRSGQRASVRGSTEYITMLPPQLDGSASAKPNNPPAPAGDNKNGNANVNANANPPAPAPSALTLGVVPMTMTTLGAKWEIDPVIGPDGETIDISIGLDFHYAPPSFRYDTKPGGDKVLRTNAPATDFHKAVVNTSLTMSSGMTRLLGVWKPEGAPEFDKGDVLQAAFLRADVVPLELAQEKK